MNAFPLQLERYFFPEQNVRGNPEYESKSGNSDTRIQIAERISPVANRKNAIVAEIVVSLDEENSDNPPYFFSISVFGTFVCNEELAEDPKEMMRVATGVGKHMLIGAARERLASLTSRGPWGAVYLPPVPLMNPNELESDDQKDAPV